MRISALICHWAGQAPVGHQLAMRRSESVGTAIPPPRRLRLTFCWVRGDPRHRPHKSAPSRNANACKRNELLARVSRPTTSVTAQKGKGKRKEKKPLSCFGSLSCAQPSRSLARSRLSLLSFTPTSNSIILWRLWPSAAHCGVVPFHCNFRLPECDAPGPRSKPTTIPLPPFDLNRHCLARFLPFQHLSTFARHNTIMSECE